MNDFFDLAQLAKPTMMPNAPSPVQGYMYGMDSGRHDQMLREAQTLASLNARMRAMEAEEKSAGHEGRMADARVKSAISMDDKANLGSILSGRKTKRDADSADSKQKMIQDQINSISHWVDSWDGADDETKGQIHQIMKDEGTTIGSRKLGDFNPQQLDKVMKMFRLARERNPKLEAARINQQGASARADAANKSRERIAAIREQARAASEKSRKEGKQISTDQLAAGMLRAAVDAGEISAKEALDAVIDLKTNTAETRVATTPPRVTLENGRVTTKPVQGPAPVKNPLPDKKTKPAAPDAAIKKFKEIMAGKDEKLKQKALSDWNAKGWKIPD